MRRALLILLLPLVAVAPLAADNVYLKNGRVFEDVIAEVGDEAVRIHLAFGEMSVSLDTVDRIERAESSLVAYQQRRDALRADPSSTAEQWMELARWSEGRGDSHSAREATLAAAARNPDAPGLAELMRDIDHVFEPMVGAWIPLEESMHLKGYRRFDDQWLSPQQQTARSQALLEQARLREAEEDRQLTRAVLAAAAASLAREPEPPPIAPWSGYGYGYGYRGSVVVGRPIHRPRPPVHRPRPEPFAIPIERRQPGSLFPIASSRSHRGGSARVGGGGAGSVEVRGNGGG